MTWIVFCNTPSGEKLSREVQKYHTHNIWAPIAFHCNVAIGLREFKFVYVTKHYCIAKQFWGYRTHNHLICLFVNLCLCFPLMYSCWVCLCCTSGPAHHSPGICPSPSALGPQSAGTTLLNLRPLQHFHPACLCMCVLVFVFTRSPIELLLGT